MLKREFCEKLLKFLCFYLPYYKLFVYLQQTKTGKSPPINKRWTISIENKTLIQTQFRYQTAPY